jgi:cysteine desulfurase / selenocysteine lyase
MIVHYGSDFPLLRDKGLIYCDNAATTQKPQHVLDAVHAFYTETNANVHRSAHRMGELATETYEQARAVVARFIGADKREVVFCSGATDGINAVAAAWATNHCRKGDRIVLSELEHHANILPWQRVCQQTGASLAYIPIDAHGIPLYDMLDQIITPATKLVAITHVSNAIGTPVNIQVIVERARVVGAKVLLDAAQSVGHTVVNVKQLDVDFLVFSGHKIFGPTGIGVLYVRTAVHDQLVPYRVGGGMVEDVSYYDASFAGMPHLLEAGTPAVAQAVGLAAAIQYRIARIDYDWQKKAEQTMMCRLIDGLQHLPGIRMIGPHDLLSESHIVSFTHERMHAHDIMALLDRYNIAVRAGHHCARPLAEKLHYGASVRVSVHAAYNSVEHIDRILTILGNRDLMM